MQLGHPNNRNNRKLVKCFKLRQSINKRYESLIGKAFDDFLETKQFLSKPPPNHWYLENQLQSAGKHRIRFSIENASPNFFVTVVLNEVSEDGTEVKNLRSFDIDHNSFPDFGTIPPLVVWVRYRPDD